MQQQRTYLQLIWRSNSGRYILVESIYKKLCEMNLGLCQKSGKSFGELMPHFICGLDEMCPQSDANSDTQVFGSAKKKIHKAMIAYKYIHLWFFFYNVFLFYMIYFKTHACTFVFSVGFSQLWTFFDFYHNSGVF